MEPSRKQRVWWIACAALYAIANAVIMVRRPPSSDLLAIAARVVFLLPALFLARRAAAPGEWRPPRARYTLIFFLVAACALSFRIAPGILISDESAYRFEAKIFASGHLMSAPLPGAAAEAKNTPRELYFEQHILTPRGWLVKYYPGWPLLLAPFTLARLEWLANPLLGVALLGITWLLARRWFDPFVAGTAVMLLALSPFVLTYSTGGFSDMFCSVLIAGAWLFLARALDTRRIRDLCGLFTLIAIACITRPYTGFVAGLVVTGCLALPVWRDRAFLLRAAAVGCFFGALAATAYFGYNYAVTGWPTLSPYAAARGLSKPAELTLNPRAILDNLLHDTRWSLQSTAANVYPFLFILAAVEFRRRIRDTRAWTLFLLFPALVLFYLAQPEASGGRNGERYYIEGLFGLAILAAAALRRLQLPRLFMWTLTAAQLTALAASAPEILRVADPYIAVHRMAMAAPFEHGIVFIAPSTGYMAHLQNLNDADWRGARLVFLVDPGPGRRDAVAAGFGRAHYEVLTYDTAASQARVLASQ